MRRKFSQVAARISIAVALGAAFIPAVASPADASGTPSVTLTETAPATVLYGTPATVSLKAENLTATSAYNLTVSDVLPVGVAYVPSSTSPSSFGEPTVIANAPSAGRSTLVWSNIADLQAASSATIAFNLQGAIEPAANTQYPGASYSDAASAYVNTNARTIPKFDASGVVVPGSWTGSGTASGTTKIVPLTVSEAENSPEHELPRGVHNDKATYTVTVTNNSINATNSAFVDEYLPAGLEFLGCGGADHTTAAAPEYSGSGTLSTGTTLSSPCFAPTTVETLSLIPSGSTGSQPSLPINSGSAIYTHVRWSIGSLAAHGTYVFTYLAAVPLRSNSQTWSNGTPLLTGAEGSNLDNNNGAETHDGLTLTNLSVASGTYGGTLAGGATNPVSSSSTLAVEAVDLAIQKTVDGGSSGSLDQTSLHSWALNYQTSEYRYSTSTVITDDLPNGECPIGPSNYDAAASTDCAPQGGHTPSTSYTSVSEQTSGDFIITWNLGTLSPNTSATITFPSADRTSYQSNGGDSTPTVSNDSIINNVNIAGTVHGTCVVGTTADPTCASGTVIYSGENTPTSASNASSASLVASAPVLTKKVSTPPVSGTTDCTTATYTSTPPAYGKGDTICFQLKVQFPTGSHGRNVVITDMLPPNSTYVPGSAHAVGPGDTGTTNTVTVNSFATNPASGGSSATLVWNLGATLGSDLYVQPGQVFSYDIAMTADADPTAGNTYDIVDNLMKLSEANTAGATISLRSDANYKLSLPILAITKGIQQVNSGTVNGPNVSPVAIKAGDNVTYRLDITNNGLTNANNTAATDTLPTAITSCAMLSAISDGGVCAGSSAPYTVSWSGLAAISAAASRSLTYTVAMSSSLAAGQSLTNTAQITSYQNQPNDGAAATTYIPGSGATPAATDSATVTLGAPTMSESLTTETNETGNNTASQATPGEIVDYTVTATVPAGTTVYSAAITDPLGAKLTYVPSSVALSLDGGAATGFSASVTSNNLTVSYPSTFTSSATDRVLTITFKGTLTTNASNTRSSTFGNTSTLNFNNSLGAAGTAVTASVSGTVVEPNITVNKTDGSSGSAAPGATVNYTITVTNPTAPTNVSTAHDVVLSDVVPAGMGAPTSLSPAPSTISGQTYTWNLADVAPGATTTITYSATIPNPSTGATSFANTATANVTSLDTTASPGARTTGTGYSSAKTDTVSVPGVVLTDNIAPTRNIVGGASTVTVTVAIPANTTLPDLTVRASTGDGSTFAAYGSQTCVEADTTACSGGTALAMTPLPTPTKAAGGTTVAAWFIGDTASDTQTRLVTLTYTVYPAETTHTGAAVVAGNTITMSAAGYWNTIDGTNPTTIPPTSAFTHNTSAVNTTLTVIAPALTAGKAVSNATPVPGTAFTYTVTANNSSGANSSAAYDAVITDVVPSNLAAPSNISNSGVYNAGTRTITWTVAGPIATGAAPTFTYDTSLVSGSITTGATITNTATIASYDAVSGGSAADSTRWPSYGPSSASVDVHPAFPTLSVAKTTSGGLETASAFVGSSFGWKIIVSNATAAPASSTSVTDTLPNGWTYDAGSTKVNGTTVGDPGISGHVLTLSIGTVINGSPVTVTYTAKPDATAALGTTPNTNTAQAAGQDGSGASANATGAYQSTADTAAATIDAADLSVTKAVVGTIIPGSPSNWTVSVANAGPSAAAGPVTVIDTLPVGVTAVSGSGNSWVCTPVSNVLTCTHTALVSGAGGNSSFTVTATLPSGTTGPVTNAATISSATYDPSTSSNSTTLTTATAPSAVLSVVKTHTGAFTAGTGGTYTLALHNAGPSDAQSVTMSDPLPNGLGFVSFTGTNYNCVASSSQVVTCTRTSALVSGGSDTVVLNVNVASGYTGSIINTVTASSPTSADATSTDTIGTTPIADDLSIAKTHTGNFTAGTNGTYTITVHNLGVSDTSGPVTVHDTLPAGESFVSGSATDWSCTAVAQAVTCTSTGPLVTGATTTYPLVVAVDPAISNGTVLNSTATVSSATTDTDLTNNTDDDPTPIVAHPQLAVTMTPPTAPLPGTNAQWTINVNNSGPSNDSGPIALTDTIPTGTDFVSATGTGWSCAFDSSARNIVCNRVTPLAPGVTAPPITVVLALGLNANLDVTNVVSASSPTSTPVTTPTGGSTASVTTDITPLSDLTLEKHHVGAPAKGALSYLLTPTNNGPTADPGTVTVTDPLPNGETFVAAKGDGWTCASSSNVVSCTRTGSALGVNPPITLNVALDTKALPRVVNIASVSGSAGDPVVTNNDGNDTVQVLATQLVRQTSLARTGLSLWHWLDPAITFIVLGASLEYFSFRRRRYQPKHFS